MKKNNNNLNLQIKNAIKESNEYIEMYRLRIKNNKQNLLKLETNKPFFIFKRKCSKYNQYKNDILSDIKKYEEKIIEEENLIEIMKHNLKNK